MVLVTMKRVAPQAAFIAQMLEKAGREILQRPGLTTLSAHETRERKSQQILDRHTRRCAQLPPVGGLVWLAPPRPPPLLDERLYLRRQFLERTNVPISHEPIEENHRLNLVQRRSARLLSR